jgi:hypothetical protein
MNGNTDAMLFRPPRLKRSLQLAIGVPLTVLALAPSLLAVWLVWSPHVIELRIADGRIDIVTAPSFFGGRQSVDLDSITAVDRATLGTGRRIAGTALPGYCVGRFSYPEMGAVWQATDCSNDVVVLNRAGERPSPTGSSTHWPHVGAMPKPSARPRFPRVGWRSSCSF